MDAVEVIPKSTRWARLNREKHREAGVKYYQSNAEKRKDSATQWRKDNPDKYAALRQKYRLRKYGLSQEQYDSLLVTQKNRCAVCIENFDTNKKPCIDHNHSTGSVRGLLCAACNTGIGKLKDDPTVLRRAMNYLTKDRKGNLWAPPVSSSVS